MGDCLVLHEGNVLHLSCPPIAIPQCSERMATGSTPEEEAELCTLLSFTSTSHLALPGSPAEALRDPRFRRSLEAAQAALHLPARPERPPRGASSGSSAHPTPHASSGAQPDRAKAPPALPPAPPPSPPPRALHKPPRTACSHVLAAVFADATSSRGSTMDESLGSQIATSAVPGSGYARGVAA